MNNDLVSVILPVFNCRDYISSALSSLIAQSYEHLEIIIVNDGSTDGTLDICNNFADRDPRIRLYSRENHGISSSLNFAISLAKGNWIARMDADDISMVHRIKSQLLFAKANGIDVLGSNTFLFSDNLHLGQRKYPITNAQIRCQALFNSPLCHPSVFVKTKILKHYRYDSSFDGIEDYELWLRMMRDQDIVFANFNQPLFKYRKSKFQTTYKSRSKNISRRCALSISYAHDCLNEPELISVVKLYFSLLGCFSGDKYLLTNQLLSLKHSSLANSNYLGSLDLTIVFSNLFKACLLSNQLLLTPRIFNLRHLFGFSRTLFLFSFLALPISIRKILLKCLLTLS